MSMMQRAPRAYWRTTGGSLADLPNPILTDPATDWGRVWGRLCLGWEGDHLGGAYAQIRQVAIKRGLHPEHLYGDMARYAARRAEREEQARLRRSPRFQQSDDEWRRRLRGR